MKSILIACSTALLLAISVCTEISAQAVRTISTTGRRLDEFSKLEDKVTKDALNREITSGRKLSKEEVRRAAQIRIEVKEDLETLQVIYNDLVTRLGSKEQLSADHVRETSARARKHAERLRTNIPFPKEEATPEKTSKSGQPKELRPAVRAMCLAIYDLLTNPTIENIGLVDVERSNQAREALERLLETSLNLSEPGS